MNKSVEKMYQGIIVFLILSFIGFFIFEAHNFSVLEGVVSDYQRTLESQRTRYEQLVRKWEKDYEELEMKYASLLKEVNYED